MATPTWDALDPEDAIAYFRAKGLALGLDWRDVWGEEHAVAFTAAKAMSLDLLAEIRAAVDAALAEGQTLEQFREALAPLLIARGWWGRREVIDPLTGEVREAQLGSARRLQTIFDTNLRTAYAAGHWAEIQRTKADAPWLVHRQHRIELRKSACSHYHWNHNWFIRRYNNDTHRICRKSHAWLGRLVVEHHTRFRKYITGKNGYQS
jgi:hypothetical protein